MVTLVPTHLLETLASTAPSAKSQQPARRSTFPRANDFDIKQWIATYATDAGAEESWPGGGTGAKRWVFKTCPFNEEHRDHSACIVQYSDGRLGFKCHHNGCSDKDWHALRALREPGWQERRASPGHGTAEKDSAAPINFTFR